MLTISFIIAKKENKGNFSCLVVFTPFFAGLLFYMFHPQKTSIPGGRHNMLRVRVCAAHMGGFLGPKLSKQGSIFRQIFLKHGWVFQKLTKIAKNR